MDSQKQYRLKEERIVDQIKEINLQGGSIAVAKRTSNLFRNRKETKARKLDFKDLNCVINVDKNNLIGEVEAATTYQDLVEETLKYGLLPAVVPQFITITVGGGLSGGACEASSFRYGATHETVEEMTILLSNGTVVTASPNNNYKDLFFAIPNTFGSLGYVLKLRIKLIPAKPFIKLQHIHFSDQDKYFATIETIMKEKKYNKATVDYLDGIIWDEKNCYLTIAQFVDTVPFTSNYKYMQIYYQSISKKKVDYLTTRDFIWRWDADWTWGSRLFGMQNKLLRFLFGKVMLNSFSYWKVVRFDRKYKIMDKLSSWTKQRKETMIQDVEIPIKKSSAFLNNILKNIPVRPIWVCPMKSYRSTPFSFIPLSPKELHINYGIWGSIASTESKSSNHYNRMLEKAVIEFKSYKSLYSEVFFTQDEFWQLHDKMLYQKLKKKYDPQNRLRNFYQKVYRETS